MGCWEVDPTGVTGGEGEGKVGVTPGFLGVMVPFPGHGGAGTGFGDSTQSSTLFQNQDTTLNH